MGGVNTGSLYKKGVSPGGRIFFGASGLPHLVPAKTGGEICKEW